MNCILFIFCKYWCIFHARTRCSYCKWVHISGSYYFQWHYFTTNLNRYIKVTMSQSLTPLLFYRLSRFGSFVRVRVGSFAVRSGWGYDGKRCTKGGWACPIAHSWSFREVWQNYCHPDHWCGECRIGAEGCVLIPVMQSLGQFIDLPGPMPQWAGARGVAILRISALARQA